MKRNKGTGRFTVSADGKGIISHAGSALLRELAEQTGLVTGWTAALIDTYSLPPTHAPGRVLVDLAVRSPRVGTRCGTCGPCGIRRSCSGRWPPIRPRGGWWTRSTPPRLDLLRSARAVARERAWAAGADPDLSGVLRLHFDASLLTAYSEKQQAAPTWKKGFGFHPLLCYLDRPDISGGEALAGLLRPGNAGSNTAADHVRVLDMAIAALPPQARPRPGDPTGPRLLASADSAGAGRYPRLSGAPRGRA